MKSIEQVLDNGTILSSEIHTAPSVITAIIALALAIALPECFYAIVIIAWGTGQGWLVYFLVAMGIAAIILTLVSLVLGILHRRAVKQADKAYGFKVPYIVKGETTETVRLADGTTATRIVQRCASRTSGLGIAVFTLSLPLVLVILYGAFSLVTHVQYGTTTTATILSNESHYGDGDAYRMPDTDPDENVFVYTGERVAPSCNAFVAGKFHPCHEYGCSYENEILPGTATLTIEWGKGSISSGHEMFTDVAKPSFTYEIRPLCDLASQMDSDGSNFRDVTKDDCITKEQVKQMLVARGLDDYAVLDPTSCHDENGKPCGYVREGELSPSWIQGFRCLTTDGDGRVDVTIAFLEITKYGVTMMPIDEDYSFEYRQKIFVEDVYEPIVRFDPVSGKMYTATASDYWRAGIEVEEVRGNSINYNVLRNWKKADYGLHRSEHADEYREAYEHLVSDR